MINQGVNRQIGGVFVGDNPKRMRNVEFEFAKLNKPLGIAGFGEKTNAEAIFYNLGQNRSGVGLDGNMIGRVDNLAPVAPSGGKNIAIAQKVILA